MIYVTLGVIVGVALGVIASYDYAKRNPNFTLSLLRKVEVRDWVVGTGLHRSVLDEFDDETLIQECDRRDIPRYQDPVESLQSLKDDPDIVYVWKVKDEAHRNQMIEIIEKHEHKHGEFEAIHAVTVEGEKELWRLEKQELEGYL